MFRVLDIYIGCFIDYLPLQITKFYAYINFCVYFLHYLYFIFKIKPFVLQYNTLFLILI